MFHNLTIPYAGLLLACLLTLACPLPFILIRYGETIRARSHYAAATTGLRDTTQEDGAQPSSKDLESHLSGPVLGARRSHKKSCSSESPALHDATKPATHDQASKTQETKQDIAQLTSNEEKEYDTQH